MVGFNVNCIYFNDNLGCNCPVRQIKRSNLNPIKWIRGTQSMCIEYGTINYCPDAIRYPRPAPPIGGSSAKKPENKIIVEIRNV